MKSVSHIVRRTSRHKVFSEISRRVVLQVESGVQLEVWMPQIWNELYRDLNGKYGLEMTLKDSIGGRLYKRMWIDACDSISTLVSYQVTNQVKRQVRDQVGFAIMGVNGAIEDQLFEKYKS